MGKKERRAAQEESSNQSPTRWYAMVLSIDPTDTKTGAGEELVLLTDPVYNVEADDGEWIKVRHRGVAGWLKKRYAVLPDDGVAYFSECLRANNTDTRAYLLCDLAFQMKGDLDTANNG